LEERGFSRAANGVKINRALMTAEKRASDGFVTGHDSTACGKAQPICSVKGHGFAAWEKAQRICLVTGHGFSRADKANPSDGALAPEDMKVGSNQSIPNL